MGAAAARERVRESLPVGVARERALHVRAVGTGHLGREEGGGDAGGGGERDFGERLAFELERTPDE